MKHVVLRPFPWSRDGLAVEHLPVGATRAFGRHAEGLVAAGLIEPAPGERKDAGPARENKDAGPAPANKGQAPAPRGRR